MSASNPRLLTLTAISSGGYQIVVRTPWGFHLNLTPRSLTVLTKCCSRQGRPYHREGKRICDGCSAVIAWPESLKLHSFSAEEDLAVFQQLIQNSCDPLEAVLVAQQAQEEVAQLRRRLSNA